LQGHKTSRRNDPFRSRAWQVFLDTVSGTSHREILTRGNIPHERTRFRKTPAIVIPMHITPHVHALRFPFSVPVAPNVSIARFASVFLICSETLTLVDTGVAGCEKPIFEYIAAMGRDPAEVSLIVQTHTHPDHIGATRAIQAGTGCEVAVHAAEREWIENVAVQNRERPVPGFDLLVGGSAQAGRVLADGDVISLGGDHRLDLIVFHTPGHSPGSVSLLLQSDGALFAGDAVPVPGDLPVYDDAVASVRSAQRLSRIDGITTLLSSWDEPRQGILAYTAINDGLSVIRQVHNAVIAAAGNGTPDAMELCRKAAGILGLPPQAATPLLARTFAAHLRGRGSAELP
jgi:hydroxyacylglutathione hydrolase